MVDVHTRAGEKGWSVLKIQVDSIDIPVARRVIRHKQPRDHRLHNARMYGRRMGFDMPQPDSRQLKTG